MEESMLSSLYIIIAPYIKYRAWYAKNSDKPLPHYHCAGVASINNNE